MGRGSVYSKKEVLLTYLFSYTHEIPLMIVSISVCQGSKITLRCFRTSFISARHNLIHRYLELTKQSCWLQRNAITMRCISFLGPRESQGKSLPRVWNTTSDLGWLPLFHSTFAFTFVNSPFFFFLTRPIIVGQSFTLGKSWHTAVGLSQVLYVAESEGFTRWLK